MSANVRMKSSPDYYPKTGIDPSSTPLSGDTVALTQRDLTEMAASLDGLMKNMMPTGAQSGVSSFTPASASVQGRVPAAQSVSSFTPASAVSAAPINRSAAAPGGANLAPASTPMGKAQGNLAKEKEQLRTETETVPEKIQTGVNKFNQKQGEKNDKVQEKLTKLDARIAEERAKGGDGKKLKKMQEERSEVAGKYKPPLDPKKVISDINTVMNDPQLSNKARKRKLEDIRNEYGLKKEGGSLSMNTFTQHISKKTSDSKDRVGELQKGHMKELDGQIKQAKETYGKKSPQVKELEGQKKDAKDIYDDQKDTLKDQAKMLKNSYRKPGLFGEIGMALSKIFKLDKD